MLAVAFCALTSLAGCSSTAPASSANGSAANGKADASATGDAAGGTDSAAAADAGTNNDVSSQADTAVSDAAADSQAPELPTFVPPDAKDAAAGDSIDFDLLDPEDAAETVEDTQVALPKGLETVYAHSSDTLYKLDKGAFSLIGKFSFDKKFGQVTDIALDDAGDLYAVTFGDVFACDKSTASCKWLAALPQSFNGLTFVPKDVVLPGKSALIGIANSGDWNLIEVQNGTAKVTKLGSYGGFTSSGDAFSVDKVGTYATVKSGFMGGDKLVQVNPATGAVLKTVGDCGVNDLWGVAWSQNVLYGFASSGGVYAIDINTGKAAPVPGLMVPNGVSWWGAGVSTRAAGQ